MFPVTTKPIIEEDEKQSFFRFVLHEIISRIWPLRPIILTIIQGYCRIFLVSWNYALIINFVEQIDRKLSSRSFRVIVYQDVNTSVKYYVKYAGDNLAERNHRACPNWWCKAILGDLRGKVSR